MDPMSVWATLLETAIHSPSPHNVQPWRVRIRNDRQADLLIDSARTLPKEDPTGSFIILTMGMFIEALALLAGQRRYRLEYELFHEPDWYAGAILDAKEQVFLPFAQLRLVADDHQMSGPGHDPAVFLKRRTSRISLGTKPVPSEAANALKNLAAEWNQRYEQITDSAIIERMLEQNTRALFHDLNDPNYHDEITSWFRFTDRSSLKHRDGLDYRCMNTSRTTYWMTARFPKLLLIPGVCSLLAKKYRKQTGNVPTIGMLAGDFWQPSSAIKTGRFLMRFWLETARHNLYIHPYGNLVTNKQAAQWMLTETKIPDIWLVFKIGYSDEPPKSYRRSVEEILLD
jgi:nitroreductase